MYPEDRVLVGVMPNPRDLDIAREQHWYRIPVKQAPNGIFAEYVAFYFTSKYTDDLRWGIHYFARRTGHELAYRADLFPEEPDHPRAKEHYYRVQLGDLVQKIPPILSLRWRRITFIRTTWDRFLAAGEINDLFSSDSIFVDRAYHTLRDRGIHVERAVEIKEQNKTYMVDLLIPCKKGTVLVSGSPEAPKTALVLTQDDSANLASIDTAIQKFGGPALADVPL
jgi:hypothetical protein